MRVAQITICCAVAVALLSGCADVPKLKLQPAGNYDALLATVNGQSEQYDLYANDLKTQSAMYDVGLTLLAVGSVAAAVFAHGAAKGNILAGIGIGAGGATVLWNAFRPEDKRIAYLTAAQRARCLYVSGERLNDTNSKATYDSLRQSVDRLSGLIDGVQAQVDRLLPKASTAEWRGIVSDAQVALPVARTARSAGWQELNARDARSIEVEKTLLTIDAAAEQSSRTLIVTFGGARDAINGAVNQTAATGTTATPPKLDRNGAKPQNQDQLSFDALGNDTKTMSSLASQVGASKPFTPAIEEIQKCAVFPATPAAKTDAGK